MTSTTEENQEPKTVALEDWQIRRDDFKAEGDAAFRAGGFRTAISAYSSAIDLDPDMVVLYSNRSAAYLANSESSKALRDAQKCVELDPAFAKGYSRLASALFALRRYDKAKEAYERVLEKESNNAAAKRGVEACNKELEKIRIQQQEDAQWEATESKEPATAEENVTKDEEEDDLADFFDEVEEVVTKQKEKVAAVMTAQPEATHAIRRDRTALGTTQDQISRLLQPHYEWRNLNPFYVLDLPHTATDDDISRRYKALSLLLHPDKNHAKFNSDKEQEQCQLAYDQVQKAKKTLSDDGRKRHVVALIEEGMKAGEHTYAKQQAQKQQQARHKKKWTNNNTNNDDDSLLQELQEKEVMRIFAQVEQKRRDMEERERNYEQRQQQQQDEQEAKERKERQFDKSWRQEERVDKRVGNWRDFSGHTSKKQKK